MEMTKCTLGRGTKDRACNGNCGRCGWEAGIREQRNEIIAQGLEPGEDGLRRLILPKAPPLEPKPRDARECQWCGRWFIPETGNQIYCCKVCCNRKHAADKRIRRKMAELPDWNYEGE